MRYDALYGRQSVEKKDSISVESQLEYCRYETHGDPYLEYLDKGYSGGTLKRPGFEQMMADIEAGKIKRVIVYKLDRISRSILDFANMMSAFMKYQVEFISSTEKFDTSTPIGRAMLNICIVFAQLERETIQKRVADAYYARSKRGFYMGGRVPYGYRLKKTMLDGISTAMYEEIPEESAQLRLIYSLYANKANSLGDIVRYLKEHQIRHCRGGCFNTARLSELLRNPVYVMADTAVYCFFKEQGARLCNSVSDFTGENACYLYQGTSPSNKQCDLTDKELVLAPHAGFIPSATWLACRKRCLKNRQSASSGKPKNSWLCGKVKCAHCGYAMVIRKASTAFERYFICSHAGSGGGCLGTKTTLYATVLEEQIALAIKEKLSALETQFHAIDLSPHQQESQDITAYKIRDLQLSEELEVLYKKLLESDNMCAESIKTNIKTLTKEQADLKEKLLPPVKNCFVKNKTASISYAEQFDLLSLTNKQAIADLFLSSIRVSDDSAVITFKI